MQDESSEQPLTDHLVDQFASYFLITMLTFHLFGCLKKQYEKRKDKRKTSACLMSVRTMFVTFHGSC